MPIQITDYYNHATLTEKIDILADSAPQLVDYRSIGTTPEGRELRVVTVANANNGPPVDERPALLVTANLHAPEVAGSWTALHLLRELVDGYGDQETITELVDSQTVYVLPRVSPDGAEVALNQRGKIVRSRYIEADPTDIFEANVLAPRDLTGDGRILRMRWPDEDGEMVPLDPGAPAMVAWDPDRDEKRDIQRYRVVTEGLVVNHDGGPVKDPHYGYRRSDFNRNFPTDGWQPLDWEGHGKYPLSEPETRALADFVYDHPNITAVIDLHTGNQAIFYPASLAGNDPDSSQDANTLEEIGEAAEEATGFPYIWGYGELRGESPRTELPGSFKDFAYERLGIPAVLIELGMLYNYLGIDSADLGKDPTDHERERTTRLLEYQSAHSNRPVFHPWEPFDHPDLGRVEIGGLDRTTHGNPPPSEMPDLASDVTDFALTFATYHPDIQVRQPTVTMLGDGTYRVRATVVNKGRLPTHLTEQGNEIGTHLPDRPRVELSGNQSIDVVTGRSRQKLDHLDARGGRADLEWVLQADRGTIVDITVTAARGSNASISFTLGE